MVVEREVDCGLVYRRVRRRLMASLRSLDTGRKLKGADSPQSARGRWPGVSRGKPLFVVDQSQVKAEAFIVETAKTRSETLGQACARWSIRGCAPTGSTIRAVGS
jgi:hypothetical protein